MKQLSAGHFEPQRRCIAVIDGKSYFGEVFQGQKRIFVDPEHPSLRPQAQWIYNNAPPTGSGGFTNVMFVQFA
jgi:hypothetical protein